MKYLIADIIFEIFCNTRTIDMPIYSAFKNINTNKPADITVAVQDADYMLTKFYIQDREHSTYTWRQLNDKYIMIFSERGAFLDESPLDQIWLLEGDKAMTNWNLYVPNLNSISDYEFNLELENRPWLQRLFIAFCMNTQTAVMHGALCNIDGAGCLFLGDSGVGKSTICSIIESCSEVYSDDRFIIKINDNSIKAFGTPWNTKNKKYCINKSIDVKKIYFLSHGKNQITRLTTDFNLMKMLMKQILHSGIYEPNDILYWKISMSKDIMRITKIFEFGFIPNESCIKYVIGGTDEY